MRNIQQVQVTGYTRGRKQKGLQKKIQYICKDLFLTQQKWKQKIWTKYDKMPNIVKLDNGGYTGYISLP